MSLVPSTDEQHASEATSLLRQQCMCEFATFALLCSVLRWSTQLLLCSSGLLFAFSCSAAVCSIMLYSALCCSALLTSGLHCFLCNRRLYTNALASAICRIVGPNLSPTATAITATPGWSCLMQVPGWVPPGLHTGNSIAAVLELLVCIRQRTFSKRAEIGQTVITVGYVMWLLVCRHQSGCFPYPFM